MHEFCIGKRVETARTEFSGGDRGGGRGTVHPPVPSRKRIMAKGGLLPPPPDHFPTQDQKAK